MIGFNFDKISGEKLKDRAEGLKVATNIDISDINEIKTATKSQKETIIQAKFSYNIKYEPGLADLSLKGSIFFALEEEKANEIIKGWKKKELPEEFKINLFNLVVSKSVTKALILEEDLSLPPHVPLPHFQVKKEK
jgi:hypothetical protein